MGSLPPMFSSAISVLCKYAKFVGPGILVSVAYMDPGNYSTAVSAGAEYQYHLLFTVLLSNVCAVVLQVLCAKLGAVTGLNLAENCRKHLPKWLNVVLYVLTEIAIIATDLAEVVGTAIALNILLHIPLTLGVVLTVIDVLIVLAVYNPQGPMRAVRYFEYLVSALVAVVVVCFAVELAHIKVEEPAEVFAGFLPSKYLMEKSSLYLSCGILGATVMPHSLYLGSGIVQPRLKDFDVKRGNYKGPVETDADSGLSQASKEEYHPSLSAIKYCMNYTLAELVISLCTVAIFVNAAILIVAGATMYKTEEAYDADLFSIYEMLVQYLGQVAGTVFALALLFSGQSSGVICTLAGQMVSEGFIHWSVKPWLRRIITRSLAIAPCLFVSIFVGRSGLASVLNASQVVLSLLLPFVCAPLIYFTGSKKVMRVQVEADTLSSDGDGNGETLEIMPAEHTYSRLEEGGKTYKVLSNSMAMHIVAGGIFVIVSVLNLFLIASMAFGSG